MNKHTIRIKATSPRAERFQRVFCRLTGIPVVHDHAIAVTDPADGREKSAYVLNIKRLTSTELNNLVSYYADLTNTLPDEIRVIIKSDNILIDASDCEIEADHAS